MIRSLRLFVVFSVLSGLAAAPAQAEGDCQQVSITCTQAKKQNQGYCASERRVQSGMSYDGCIASGERAMQDCLKTGRWVSGKRNLCGLTRR
ncbi:MAG: hypothetical protein AB7O88_11325 [Reyranellaceae bacterium]